MAIPSLPTNPIRLLVALMDIHSSAPQYLSQTERIHGESCVEFWGLQHTICISQLIPILHKIKVFQQDFAVDSYTRQKNRENVSYIPERQSTQYDRKVHG